MPNFVPGRLPPHPVATHPRLYASVALKPGYTAPDECDYHDGISFPGYLNDQIGDCTAADVGHAEQVFNYFGQGATVTVTDEDVLRLYEATSGYNGDPSTDQGAVIQDVLGYWRRTGIAGHKILAFLQVDHTSLDEIRACCWLFGGVTLGVNLPASAMTQFDAGQPWAWEQDADNSTLGGHDVRIVGYDPFFFQVVTWGKVQDVTWEWIQHTAEEAWSEATAEWIRDGKAPEGLDVDALNAAFTQLTGEPGPFPVTPEPSPTPQPPGPSVDEADRTLASTVRPQLTHLSHHGPPRIVHHALRAWLDAKGL